jgi:hypothetical protein
MSREPAKYQDHPNDMHIERFTYGSGSARRCESSGATRQLEPRALGVLANFDAPGTPRIMAGRAMVPAVRRVAAELQCSHISDADDNRASRRSDRSRQEARSISRASLPAALRQGAYGRQNGFSASRNASCCEMPMSFSR